MKKNVEPDMIDILIEDIKEGRITEEDIFNLHKEKSCLCPICTIESIQHNLYDIADRLDYLRTFFESDDDEEEEDFEDDEEEGCEEEGSNTEKEKYNEILDNLLDITNMLKDHVEDM